MKIMIQYLDKTLEKPKYATEGSAGIDISASLKESVLLKSGERALIPSGIAVKIPEGYGGFVFPRSGLSYKHGIALCNSVGVIDSDYIGEIKVAVYNNAKEDYTINHGDRIAQMVIMPVAMAELIECESLEETQRGSGGFGSTGK